MKNGMLLAVAATLFSMGVMTTQAGAIGTWLQGRLDAPVWQENGYSFVLIDGVRYSIMKEAQVLIVTSREGMYMKNPAELGQMRTGDSLTVQRSGNRIYAIEVNR